MNSKACEGPGTIYTDEFEQIIYNEMRKRWLSSKRSEGVKEIILTPS